MNPYPLAALNHFTVPFSFMDLPYLPVSTRLSRAGAQRQKRTQHFRYRQPALVETPPADARHDVLHLLRMALPESIRVKLSSEEAGAISITAVVVREMAARELIE